jgi:hypothetical protein
MPGAEDRAAHRLRLERLLPSPLELQRHYLLDSPAQGRGAIPCYHAFGLVGTALSKKISVFQPSSLKVVPISPNAW